MSCPSSLPHLGFSVCSSNSSSLLQRAVGVLTDGPQDM